MCGQRLTGRLQVVLVSVAVRKLPPGPGQKILRVRPGPPIAANGAEPTQPRRATAAGRVQPDAFQLLPDLCPT
jgi:hypothetical protein